MTPEDVISNGLRIQSGSAFCEVSFAEKAERLIERLATAGYTVISTEELQRERLQSRCAGCGEVDVGAYCGWCYEN